MPKRKIGKIITTGGVDVWPHDMASAKILIRAVYNVEFIPESKRTGEKRADCYLDDVLWEMKSLDGRKLGLIERGLKKASHQSSDPRRVKRIPGKAIKRELKNESHLNKSTSRLKFINRSGKNH